MSPSKSYEEDYKEWNTVHFLDIFDDFWPSTKSLDDTPLDRFYIWSKLKKRVYYDGFYEYENTLIGGILLGVIFPIIGILLLMACIGVLTILLTSIIGAPI